MKAELVRGQEIGERLAAIEGELDAGDALVRADLLEEWARLFEELGSLCEANSDVFLSHEDFSWFTALMLERHARALRVLADVERSTVDARVICNGRWRELYAVAFAPLGCVASQGYSYEERMKFYDQVCQAALQL